jgi:hypothetical protein
MPRQVLISLISHNLIDTAFSAFIHEFGATAKIVDLRMRFLTLEDDFDLGRITGEEYRRQKTGILTSFINYIDTFNSNEAKVNEKINTTNNIVMEIHIANQIVNGQVNMADVIAIGDKFAEEVLKRTGKPLDEADTHLVKAVGAIADTEELKTEVTGAIETFNDSDVDVPKKAKAKNKITDFLLTYGVPTAKVLGRVALGIVLAKYGIKIAELGLTD